MLASHFSVQDVGGYVHEGAATGRTGAATSMPVKLCLTRLPDRACTTQVVAPSLGLVLSNLMFAAPLSVR